MSLKDFDLKRHQFYAVRFTRSNVECFLRLLVRQ